MDQFKSELKEFTELNIHWIQDVGQAVLEKLDLRARTYVNGINQGTVAFDELALFIACRCFNIHAIVMLDNDVWSTETDVLHSKATVRLAFCGKNTFREIVAINDEVVMELPGCIPESVDMDVTDSDSGYEDTTGDMEEENPLDLHVHVSDDDVIFVGTSQLGPEELSAIVVKPEPVEQDDDDVVYVDTVYLTEDEIKAKRSSVQVKNDPDGPVNAAPDGSSVSNNPDESSAASNPQDSSVSNNPDEPSAASNPQDVASTSTSTRYNRTYLERSYKCHLCDLQTEIQIVYIKHMSDKHPDEQVPCRYCGKLFQTTNGLFKHERSHLYLNHKCQQCSYKAQFPYQLQQHQRTHTQQNMWMCAHCDKVFACKSSRNTHEQGHNINLKCQQCPEDTKKTFSSQTALNQHIRGQHGPGWTTFCQQTYKWKSKFSRHNSECKQCIKYKADLKLKRYAFLSHIALD